MKKRVIAIILLSLICIETVFAGEIVKPQSIYESVNFSKSVNKTIMALKERYPDTIKVFEIGKSVQGEAILAVEGYKGPSMISEPETKALVELCQERLFDGTVSYHSSGEVIFWHFNQKEVARDYQIAVAVSKATGYKLIPKGNPSRGNGFKDWFIETYEKPGLTIEISPYVGPQKIPFFRYQSIWEKNKNVPIIFASQVNTSVQRKIPYTPKPIVPEIPEIPEVPKEEVEETEEIESKEELEDLN